MILHFDAIQELPSRYRAELIHQLIGIKTAVLIGSGSKGHANENLAVFNSLIHIGANPPLYGIIFRPIHVRRDTYNNILNSREFTINFMHNEFAEKVHQTSASYPEDQSEFVPIHLTPEYKDCSVAPFVLEATVKVALTLEEVIPIKSNQTILVIGKINYIEFPDDLVDEHGSFQHEKARLLYSSGLLTYYISGKKIGKFPYAEPDAL
jgi:flavin reductase (DIM6/NTAB) family NADH-FMN oxidoreductase RutF